MPNDRDEVEIEATADEVEVEVEGTEPGAREQRAKSPEAEQTADAVERGVETAAAGARAFSETVERERLDEEAARAIRQGGDAARQVQSEINRQWESRTGPVGRMRDQVERMQQEGQKEMQRLRSNLQQQMQEETGRMRQEWEQERGFPGAVHRSVERAQEAPQRIGNEIRSAWSDIVSDVGQMITAGSLTFLLGALALLAFTWWMGIAISEMVGFPLGVLITALIYAVIALATMAWARGAAKDIGKETRQATQETRDEVRRVVAPVTQARPEAQRFAQHARSEFQEATQQVRQSGQRVAQAAGAPGIAQQLGGQGGQSQQTTSVENMTPADLVGRNVYGPNGQQVGTVSYASTQGGRVTEIQVRPSQQQTRTQLGGDVTVPVSSVSEQNHQLTLDRDLTAF